MTLPDAIRTQRLVLRPYTHADAPRVLAIHSRMDVIRWLSNPPFVPMADLEEARAWIDRVRAKQPPAVSYAIERPDGVVAGSVGVHALQRLDGSHHDEYETGWHLHPDSAGHGYVTEAASALLDHALGAGGVADLWCGMYPDNEPSIAVARRLGLEDRGVVDDPWYGDRSRLFHVTAADWMARW